MNSHVGMGVLPEFKIRPEPILFIAGISIKIGAKHRYVTGVF